MIWKHLPLAVQEDEGGVDDNDDVSPECNPQPGQVAEPIVKQTNLSSSPEGPVVTRRFPLCVRTPPKGFFPPHYSTMPIVQ